MRYAARRFENPAWVGTSNAYDQRRIAEMKQARCANCDSLWPWSMLTELDGRWYCPNDIELNQRQLAEMLAESQREGAEKPTRYLTIQRPIDAMTQNPAGAITSLTTSAGVPVTWSAPLNLTRGGAAVTLKLGGIQMSTDDVLTYTSGISNNTSPVITPTLTTLSLVASGGATPGNRYSLTFNGSVFRNIISVR